MPAGGKKRGLPIIHFDTNGGAELADIKGVPGDTAELPVPTNTGSTFSGWFYDRECTRACSTVVFPPTGQSLTLYAGWNIKEPWVKVDFESPAFLESGWWNVNSSYSAKYMTFPEGFAHGGNRSLKFEYAAGAKENTKASLSVVMYKNNNHVTVETGKSYSMTFWVQCRKAFIRCKHNRTNLLCAQFLGKRHCKLRFKQPCYKKHRAGRRLEKGDYSIYR